MMTWREDAALAGKVAVQVLLGRLHGEQVGRVRRREMDGVGRAISHFPMHVPVLQAGACRSQRTHVCSHMKRPQVACREALACSSFEKHGPQTGLAHMGD